MFFQVIPPHFIYDTLWHLTPSFPFYSKPFHHAGWLQGPHGWSIWHLSSLVSWSHFQWYFPHSNSATNCNGHILWSSINTLHLKLFVYAPPHDIIYSSVSTMTILWLYLDFWPIDHPYPYFRLDHQLFLFFHLFPSIV